MFGFLAYFLEMLMVFQFFITRTWIALSIGQMKRHIGGNLEGLPYGL